VTGPFGTSQFHHPGSNTVLTSEKTSNFRIPASNTMNGAADSVSPIGSCPLPDGWLAGV
jgi:hypothetical protein